MKNIVLFLIPFLLLSCSIPHYVYENKTQTTGLDFSKGKWGLNEINSPAGTQKRLTELATKDFLNYLGNRLYFIPNTGGLLLPKKIELNPTKTILGDLKKGTNFDYLINIKASNLKNDFASLDLTPHHFSKERKNEVRVVVEIYDLNLLEIIYCQSVIGVINKTKDNQDVHFSKSNNALLVSVLKRVLQNIEKKSVIVKQQA